MNRPFFSIVLPTRNRFKLLNDALFSALNQDFDDFEVIVSDNLSDDNTQTVVDLYSNDSRLIALKTPEVLSMNNHWEFATKKAQGLYVLLLTDRSVLKRHALRTIYNAIKASRHDVLVCSWRWTLYDDYYELEFSDNAVIQDDVVFELNSRKIAQNFADGKVSFHYDLPRALNSCYRSDLAEVIRKKHGAMFVPISPDFTSAFYLLAYSEYLTFIDSALFISQGLKQSTGGGNVNSIKATSEYMKLLGEADHYSQVPIKIALVENLIFQDFLFIQSKSAGNLCNIKIDWANYFIANYRELINKNAIWPWSNAEQVKLLNEWKRALSLFDDEIQQKVNRATKKMVGFKLKSLIAGTLIGRRLALLNHGLKSKRNNWGAVLDLAGFSNL